MIGHLPTRSLAPSPPRSPSLPNPYFLEYPYDYEVCYALTEYEKTLKHSSKDSDKLANTNTSSDITSEGGSEMAQINRTGMLNEALNLLRQKKIQPNRSEQLPAAVNTQPRVGPGQTDMFVPSAHIDEVNRLREAIIQLPDIDEEKIAALRDSIRNGTFTIDSHQVAEKLLAAGIKPNPR